MGSLNADYRQIIENLFQEYVYFLGQDDAIQQELVFDRKLSDPGSQMTADRHDGERPLSILA